MDAIISPIITPVVEPLIVRIKKHLGFLVSSTKYVKDMKEKMDQLNLTEQDIRHNWEEAITRNHEVSHHVSPWLEEVKEMNKNTQSILDAGTGCFNIAKRYKAGKQSHNIFMEMQALETRVSEIVFTKAQIPLAEVVSTSIGPSTSNLGGTQNNFESRELIYKAALECLQPNNESHKMIALCGMGGVGKTTMMEQLKKEVESSIFFDKIVKVVLGESSDVIALQRAIAKYTTLEDLKEETKSARADRLQKMFEEMSKQGKKTLIIMDDIWSVVDLKDVGLSPLPNGFKLLFTSRFESVCANMGVKTDSIYKIPVLNEAEAKTLFFGIDGLSMSLSDGNDPELYKIGEGIVKKCGGLPIALKTIARRLIGNIKEAWEETLSDLQHGDLQDLDDIVLKVFKISYNNLQNEDEKSIFLLCGLFPEDFDIPIEDLMRYGWGLKLFTKAHTLVEARRRTIICVNNLKRANLLIESEDIGCVKMHDLVRGFALSNFSNVKQASVVYDDNMSGQRLVKDAKESYNRFLLKCKGTSEFPVDFNFPNLSLLIVMDKKNLLKFPQDIFEKSEKLEVVRCENMGIPLHPAMFEYSTKLRTLCIHSCSLIDGIPNLGSLSNLEALSFAYCGIRRLPSMIGKLKKLKLLDLTGCIDLVIDDGVFRNLGSLEELYMITGDSSPIWFTDANREELEILSQRLFALELEFNGKSTLLKNMSFKKLERFRISIGFGLATWNRKEEYSYRNTVQIVGEYNDIQECKISDLFEKTEVLHLSCTEETSLFSMDHSFSSLRVLHVSDCPELTCLFSMDHSFSSLRVLHVSNCTELTCLFSVVVANGLKKLEKLTISDCPVMRTLVSVDCTVGVIRFPKLKKMHLKDLPKMVSLCGTVIELPEMVKLRVNGLPNFTSIYPDSSDPYAIQSLLNKKVMMPNLEILYISCLENMKQIWPCHISTMEKNNASMLRKITVGSCPSLINCFPNNPLPMLNNLQEVVVTRCDSVEVIFNIDISEMEGYVSKLRSIDVEDLDKLKVLWRMTGVNDSNILINFFQGVQRIHISDCKRLKNIFTPVTTNFDLRALTNYSDVKTYFRSEEDGNIPNVTNPSYFLQTCHHLQHLKIDGDERVGEVVFDMDSPSSRQLATIQPTLPYLQSINLRNLWEISHVWKCNNWNTFLVPQQHQPLQYPFQNLTDINLGNCHNIKYLFSPLMAKYLSNLKSVEIYACFCIEEVISSRDDENEENTTSTSSALFPHLDTLKLRILLCLKSVDTPSRSSNISSNITPDLSQSGQVNGACWSLCQFPTNITIYNCDSLSSLVPWYAVGQMKRLQELLIDDCNRMTEVFESEPSTNNVDEHGDSTITTLTTATTTNIPQLSNLQKVEIIKCDLLTHVFRFTMLESLKQLKELTVKRCKAIQVIVQEEKSSEEVVVFPCLNTLVLDDLPNIKGFFLGMNEFRWPSLDHFFINDCPNLMIFTAGHSNTPKLKYVQTILWRYSLESCGINFNTTNNKFQNTFPNSSSEPTISKRMHCSFHNLIEINIYRRDVGTTVVPSDALRQLEKLQQITIELCDRLQEVFEVVALEVTNKSQTVVKIPNLTQVKLKNVNQLKYLWKSNQRMVLEFPYLTTVSIDSCYRLKHVFTCSMVGSLVQLQELHISKSNNIEVIVKEEEETERDAKVNEINVLPRLKSLQLDDLSRLKGFCLGKKPFSLPMLETLQIKRCPAIINFTKGHLSIPERTVIDTRYGKWYVKPDLNSFLKNKQEEWGKF